MKNTTAPDVIQNAHSNPDYLSYLSSIQNKAALSIAPLFVTQSAGAKLSRIFLENIPAENRQTYNCRACLDFIDRYGGLVEYDPETDKIASYLWGRYKPPAELVEADLALKAEVESSLIQHPFYTERPLVGTPQTGEYHHFSLLINSNSPTVNRTQHEAAHILIAKAKQEYRCLKYNLGVYSKAVINKAADFVDACSQGSLYSVRDASQFMRKLKTELAQNKANDKTFTHNYLWYKTISAPKAVFHLNSTIYGVILDAFLHNVPVDTLKQRLNIYTIPLNYRRPTAAPTAQLIEAATKVVNKLNLANSLPRRYATFSEIPDKEIIWRPTNPPESENNNNSPFASIIPKGAQTAKQEQNNNTLKEVQAVSLYYFIKELLPLADKFYIVDSARHEYPVGALTAPQEEDSTPILSWDVQLAQSSNGIIRNPLAHFVYSCPTSLYSQRLITLPASLPISYRYLLPIDAVIPLPANWYNAQPEGDYKGFLLYIRGAKCLESEHNGLFPAFLPNTLNEISPVIEAYAKAHPLEPQDPQVAGIFLSEHSVATGQRLKLALKRGTITTCYQIVSVK